jgi:hypothetical protein
MQRGERRREGAQCRAWLRERQRTGSRVIGLTRTHGQPPPMQAVELKSTRSSPAVLECQRPHPKKELPSGPIVALLNSRHLCCGALKLCSSSRSQLPRLSNESRHNSCASSTEHCPSILIHLIFMFNAICTMQAVRNRLPHREIIKEVELEQMRVCDYLCACYAPVGDWDRLV